MVDTYAKAKDCVSIFNSKEQNMLELDRIVLEVRYQPIILVPFIHRVLETTDLTYQITVQRWFSTGSRMSTEPSASVNLPNHLRTGSSLSTPVLIA